MAFNPFSAFRKHQKVFFAVLTIVCMITFILSFGRGDVFETILRTIGMNRKGEEVTKLYGKSVKELDLQELYRQRLLAAGFMTGNADSNLYGFMNDLAQEMSKQQVRQNPTFLHELAGRYRMRAMMARFSDPLMQNKEAVSDLQRAVRETEAPGLDRDAEQKAKLETAVEALAFQAWVTSFPRNSGREIMFYFGGSPRTADLLDFLVWRHQADQLNIVLSFEDLCKEINRRCGKDWLTADTFANNPSVEVYLASNVARKGATVEELTRALTDEFRVVLAKEAVLGSADGVPGWRTRFTRIRDWRAPAAPTPDEFLEYYRQQRTTVAVTMLPLSVEHFRKEVTATPSEATLRSFYEAYQEREPAPDQRVPGFKEPRRVRLAWFSYSPKENFYKKKAARLGGLPPLLRIGAGANNYAAGGGPLWAVQAALLASDNRYHVHYGAYLEEERNRLTINAVRGSYNLTDRRPLLQRPEVSAGLAGHLAGASGLGGAGFLTAPLYLEDTAALHKLKTLEHFGSALLACGTNSLSLAATLPSTNTLPLIYEASTRPLEEVLPQMQDKFEEKLTQEIAIQDVTALGKELERISGQAEGAAEVERILRQGEKKYGLQDVQVLKSARTAFELREDKSAELQKLKEAFERRFPPREGQGGFVEAVLEGKGVNPPYWNEEMVRTGRNTPPATRRREDRRAAESSFFQVFQDTERFENGKKIGDPDRTWMFWRVEDKAARIRSFEEVRDEVVLAWKTAQARALARKDAERIKNELKQRKGTPADAVRFLREQKGEKLIDLKRVARQVPTSDRAEILVGAGGRRFKPYKVPPDTIAYPSPDMLDGILAMQEPGDAVVVSDRPQMHFYVTVLMERPDVPTMHSFADIYREPVGSQIDPETSTLWQQLLLDRREDFEKKVMEQLRAEAGKVDDDGNFVIPDKIRERQDRSSEAAD